MSFLAKIKAKRAAENKEVVSEVMKEANMIVEDAEKKAEAEPPRKKGLAGILARKKAAEAEKAAKAVETIVPTSKEPEKEQKKAEEENIAKVEASKVKEVPAETVEETKNEEVTDELATEEVPKRKIRRPRTTVKKVSAKKEESFEDTPKTITMLNAREFQIQNIIDTKMSFEEMVAKYESSFEDAAWTEFQNNIIAELEEIRVAADMNPGTLRVTLTQLSDLDGKITIEHAKFKGLLESLTNKEDGVCTCIRYQAMANGANENERRANGYAALSNATYKGQQINFVNLIAGTRMKYIFLDSIKQRIKSMSSMCITFLGTVKVENSMDAMAASAR